ncbi:MAG TPA: SulP family inorganic anion transporter [Gemmatimonadales bacterium]|nr:SulP family inorganic anion transporter [Gemmatimonadales bacterium]
MTMDSPWRMLRQDGIAGLINAVVSVPDGLASAALAGVNPIHGLYTSIAAPLVGGAMQSAQLMQIATTSASALTAGQAIAAYPEGQRGAAMFLLVALSGALLALAGLLRLGRFVRFVSHAVMTGFLIGVAAVLVLDQLGPLVGLSPAGPNEVAQFIDLLGNLRALDVPTLATGLSALALAAGLARTRLATVASLLALVVPSVLVALVGWEGVRRVADVSPIPRGVPALALPDVSLLSPDLTLAAVSLALVIAVQGAGVSQSVENADGSPVSPSRDLVAQGAANVACGLFSGIPAGGSVGQTALNVSVGARSRWSAIFGALWMLAFLVLVPGLVGRVPMAVLAAIMILAGLSAIDMGEARSIWRTGGTARWTILATFVATLLLPIPVAVGFGVGLSILLYVASAASDVSVRGLVRRENGSFAETTPPAHLPGNAVTVLDIYGSLFFAGARTLSESLPDPAGASRPVVVLRLRGRTRVGSTLIEVLDDYADDLREAGGRLYLSGVHADVARQLRDAGKLELGRDIWISPAGEIVGASTDEAIAQGNAWLGGRG